MKKDLLCGAAAAIALGLAGASMAQSTPPPIDPATSAMPQCAGLTGTARDLCLSRPTARIPSLSENAPARVGFPSGLGTGSSGIGSTPGSIGGGSISGGSIGGGSSLSGAPRP